MSSDEKLAVFLGWTLCPCGNGPAHYKYGPYEWQTVEANKMNFSTDWRRLMLVVEKICAHGYEIDEDGVSHTAYPRTFGMRDEDGNYMIRFNRSSLHSAPTLIAAVYAACVEWVEFNGLPPR